MVNPFLQSFARGALATFGSTAIACGLACQVEKSAHQLLFRLAPQKYATVDEAYGLTEEQLWSVRHLRASSSSSWMSSASSLETTTTYTKERSNDTTSTFGLATPLHSATFVVNRDGESLLSM